MEILLNVLRVLGISAMTTAFLVSGVELWRLRGRYTLPMKRGLWSVFVVSAMGWTLRLLTTINAYFADIDLTLLAVVANSFFVVLGVMLALSAVGMYREEMTREAIKAVEYELEKRLSG